MMILLPPEENDDEFTTKVFTNDDHTLKLLGELLSNQVSRDIIRLLIEKEMYANEIASKLHTQFSLIYHHLKKMEELGLLFINEKKIIKKGQLHKYYKMNSGIFILPSHTKEAVNDEGILEKIFKKGIKFATIGIVSIASYVLTQSPSSNELVFANADEINLTWPLLIIVIGLITERVFSKIKKRMELWINRK